MLPEPELFPTNLESIRRAFDREALRRICQMPERRFVKAFHMEKHRVFRPKRFSWDEPANFYAFRDNGSNVLAVAHLDTVVWPNQRQCGFLDTADGTVIYSGALDDRLGAYVILDMLPKLGINVDVLLTVGEESGQSTAEFFKTSKEYNWIIEFDRGGTDVVMYQFEDDETCELVEMTGARVGVGIFSDISLMEHLGVKAFNWGVGYQDYHSTRSHAWLADLFKMVDHFVDFHDLLADTRLPHEETMGWSGGYSSAWSGWNADVKDNDKDEPDGTLDATLAALTEDDAIEETEAVEALERLRALELALPPAARDEVEA